jgi:hypothetical protein
MTPAWAPRIWIENFKFKLCYPSLHGGREHTVEIPVNYSAVDVFRRLLDHPADITPKISEPAMPTQDQLTALYREISRVFTPTKVPPKKESKIGAPEIYVDLDSLFGDKLK